MIKIDANGKERDYFKYMHVERLDTDEVEGITTGRCYAFYKVDGTAGSVWMEGDDICCGSRNRRLSLENDNQGFMDYCVNNANIEMYLVDHPNHVLFGEWLCLSGDTEIRLVSGGKRGHYMTLREMYKYATTPVEEVSNFVKKDGTRSVSIRQPWWERNGYPQLFSWFEDEDCIKPQRMAKIVYTGDKEVYEVVTRRGRKIKSTLDHKFLTNSGWKPLKEILVGDVVATTELTNYRPHRRYGKGSRAIQDMFKELRDNGVCNDCGNESCLEVHHKDLDWKNNEKSNLEILCKDCHAKKHKNVSAKNQEYDYEFDKVVSIDYVGIEDCYDISMGAPENSSSFVANNFIVHNCPHSLKTYRKDAWRRFYIYDVALIKDDGTFEYLPYDIYQPLVEWYSLDYIPPIRIFKNPQTEYLYKCLDETGQFLVEDGKGNGEGIVIKNYDYYNKYGRQTWAKIVSNEFKEVHRKTMGAPETNATSLEERIVDKYITCSLVEKEFAKIVAAEGGWKSQYIPRLLNTVWYELINEEMWNIIKFFKPSKIDFKFLQSLVVGRVKELKSELFM